jgi:hypothetical protein
MPSDLHKIVFCFLPPILNKTPWWRVFFTVSVVARACMCMTNPEEPQAAKKCRPSFCLFAFGTSGVRAE